MPGTVPGTVSGTMLGTVPGTMSGIVPGTMSGTVPGTDPRTTIVVAFHLPAMFSRGGQFTSVNRDTGDLV
jgi:hypothetical protein